MGWLYIFTILPCFAGAIAHSQCPPCTFEAYCGQTTGLTCQCKDLSSPNGEPCQGKNIFCMEHHIIGYIFMYISFQSVRLGLILLKTVPVNLAHQTVRLPSLGCLSVHVLKVTIELRLRKVMRDVHVSMHILCWVCKTRLQKLAWSVRLWWSMF